MKLQTALNNIVTFLVQVLIVLNWFALNWAIIIGYTTFGEVWGMYVFSSLLMILVVLLSGPKTIKE